MKRIILVMSQDNETRQIVHRWLQKISDAQECVQSRYGHNTFVKIVFTNSILNQDLDTYSTNSWLLVNEAVTEVVKHDHQKSSEQWTDTSMKDLSMALHEVADSLPYLGYTLDIVFFVKFSEGQTFDSDSIISTAGALRRLVDWHSGIGVIVKLGHELPPLVFRLAEFGHCHVVSSVDELTTDWPCWRGKVAVMDLIENRGHVFPDFWLCCDDWDALLLQKLQSMPSSSHKKRQKAAVTCESVPSLPTCGRTIEVLQEVDLRTYPFYQLDSSTLQLHVHQHRSESLVQYIQSMEQSGLLARLRLYQDSSKIPLCGSMNLSTLAWKDRVISDIQNIYEPQEEQVSDEMMFLYFLLLPSRGHIASSSCVVAQVLLSPQEINSNMLRILENHILVKKPATKRGSSYKCENISNELILDKKDRAVLLLDFLKKNVKYSPSDYTDGENEKDNTAHKSFEDAAIIQQEIISAVFSGCETMQEVIQDSTRYYGDDIRWISEAALDSSKFPEKLALQAKEVARKSLQSFPSLDSLTASSPLSFSDLEKKKNSADFDACDVLQFFNRDGSLKAQPAGSAKLRGHRLCRVDSQPDLKLQWPNSKLLRFHDIYYYIRGTDWRMEERYAKVRDRGFFQDTRSSFVSPVKKGQPTKPACSMSPIRWMPRRSATAQHLMASSGLDTSQRVSQRKRNMQDYAFKQPASHLYSPRKLSQRTSLSTRKSSQSSDLPPLKRSYSDSTRISPYLTDRNSRSMEGKRSKDQTDSTPVRISAPGHRNISFSVMPSEPEVAFKHNKRSSGMTSPFVISSASSVRRSPRKSVGSTNSSESSTEKQNPGSSELKYNNAQHLQAVKYESSIIRSNGQLHSAKMKRSERHKLKLERIINHVLKEKGVEEKNVIYTSCFRNLFNVSMVLLKTLPTSQNLTEEMKTVVYAQVTQIISLEKRRCGMNL